MDKIFSNDETDVDTRVRMASIFGVYAPLLLILTAALVIF